MNQIKLKLGKLESIFKGAKAPLLQYLNPGLQEDEIEIFFSRNNINLHPDLLELYEWHNGLTSVYGQKQEILEFAPSASFLNLSEALSLRNDFISYNYFEVADREEYFPFFSGGEDDMHLFKITTGEIYHSCPIIQIYCDKVFPSLSLMLDFFLNCYETEVLKIHPIEGLLSSENYFELYYDNSKNHSK